MNKNDFLGRLTTLLDDAGFPPDVDAPKWSPLWLAACAFANENLED